MSEFGQRQHHTVCEEELMHAAVLVELPGVRTRAVKLSAPANIAVATRKSCP